MADEINIKVKSSKKLLFIIVITIVIGLFSINVAMFAKSKFAAAKDVKKQLSLGTKYLSELDYEQAIVAYELAIEIDPKSKDAYLGLLDVYISMGELGKAEEILYEIKNIVDEEEFQRLTEQMDLAERKKKEEEALMAGISRVTVTPRPKSTEEPEMTVTEEPTLYPEHKEIEKSTLIPDTIEKDEKLSLKINTMEYKDIIDYEYLCAEGTTGLLRYDSASLFGNFSWSRELAEEDIVGSSHTAWLYDSEGKKIELKSFFADVYDGTFAGQLPTLKKGNYTYMLKIYIGDREYSDEVSFVLGKDIVLNNTNRDDVDVEDAYVKEEQVDFTISEMTEDRLKIQISRAEVQDSINYEYLCVDGTIGLLRYDSTSLFGKFSWSRELTEEEIERSYHTAWLYDNEGKKIELKSFFMDTYDGTFAGQLPELEKGSYVYKLMLYIGDKEYTDEIEFTLDRDIVL